MKAEGLGGGRRGGPAEWRRGSVLARSSSTSFVLRLAALGDWRVYAARSLCGGRGWLGSGAVFGVGAACRGRSGRRGK